MHEAMRIIIGKENRIPDHV